jgi:hypothetical protein
MVMVFNSTFNNISAISWLSVLLVEEFGVPRENHRGKYWCIISHGLLVMCCLKFSSISIIFKKKFDCIHLAPGYKIKFTFELGYFTL